MVWLESPKINPTKKKWKKNIMIYPLNLYFYILPLIFRNNEIGAVIGINQLKNLDKNNKKED